VSASFSDDDLLLLAKSSLAADEPFESRPVAPGEGEPGDVRVAHGSSVWIGRADRWRAAMIGAVFSLTGDGAVRVEMLFPSPRSGGGRRERMLARLDSVPQIGAMITIAPPSSPTSAGLYRVKAIEHTTGGPPVAWLAHPEP
jgi:hypothetical protein